MIYQILKTLSSNLDVELGSTGADKYVNIIEPAITRQGVLIPAALPLDSLSAPIKIQQVMKDLYQLKSQIHPLKKLPSTTYYQFFSFKSRFVEEENET